LTGVMALCGWPGPEDNLIARPAVTDVEPSDSEVYFDRNRK
jgi:hypothetical protein